jgi:hypothetical protein
MSPASIMRRATSATRRIFSTAIGVGEAQILVEAVADIVAIQQVGVPDRRTVQLLLHQVGNGRLARAREAREPEHAGLLILLRRAARLVRHRAPASAGSACGAPTKCQHARADGIVADADRSG